MGFDSPRSANRCTCTTLRKASRRVSQMFDEALSGAGLRTTQFAILFELAELGDKAPSLQDLASILVLDRGGLGHALRPLERDGLVALLEDPADRRRRSIVLTAKGRSTERRARSLWKVAEKRFTLIVGQTATAKLGAQLYDIAYDERLGRLSD